MPTTITSGDQVLVNAAGNAMTLYTLDSGATLEDSSANQGTIGSLDGNGNVQMDGGGASLAVGTPLNEYDVFAGSFTGNGTNTGGGTISMDGAGSLAIGAINQGTAPQTSGPGSFQVAVQSGLLMVSNTAYLGDGTDVPGLKVSAAGAFGGPGTVNDSGQALFQSGSKFAVVLGGLTAGQSTQLIDTDSDSNSNGTAVQIGGSNLDLLGFENGYEPVAGDTFTIISTSNGTISGQFANAAAGATITVDNVPFQVNYTPDGKGDGNAVAVTLTALGTMTTTQLASSSNPAYFGGPITFTATVASRAGAISAGTVTFEQGSTVLAQNVAPSAGGMATSPAITSLATGNQPITVVYSGEDSGGVDDVGSTASIIQTINPVNTSTNLISSLNPSTSGQSVTFTATVQNAVAGSTSAPTGTVQFIINGVNYQSPVTLVSGTGNSSTASVSDAALTPGVPYVVTAVYSNSDGNYVGGTSNQVTQHVEFGNYATATNVTSTANPSHYGQYVTFIATVENTSQGGGAPTGSVQFYIDGTKYLGAITLVADGADSSTAIVSAPILAAGNPHTVYAVFTNQDGNYVGGTSNQIKQNVSTDATTTTLVSNTATSYAGQPVTFVAAVQNNSPGGAGAPTGSVQFYVDKALYLGPIALTAASGNTSTATISDSGLAVGGTHTVYAVYSNADGDFTSAIPASNNVTESVSQYTTKMVSLTVVVVPKKNKRSRPKYELEAVVVTSTPGYSGVYPVGYVSFAIKGRPVGTAQPLKNGAAFLQLGAVNPRRKKYEALFQGSTNFVKSPSPVTLT